MRGQVSRKIMANSCEWGYEERQAGGKRRGRAEGMLMWERGLFPLEEIKAFLLLLKVIRLQVERGPEKAENAEMSKLVFSVSTTILFNHASGVALTGCQPAVGAPLRSIISTTTTGWIVILKTKLKFCTDVHGPQRKTPTGTGDPLTSHLSLSPGQNFNLRRADLHMYVSS